MKIHVMSDLHLEVASMSPIYRPPKCDVVVLAGDISNGSQEGGLKGINWASRTFDVPVVMVAGNHEGYGASSIQRQYKYMLKRAEELRDAGKEIHFLQDGYVEIKGRRFIGSTLWTNFNLDGNRPFHMATAHLYMNDYHRIRMEPNYRKLDTQWVAEAFMESRDFIKAACREGDIVVTHHAPSPKSIGEKFAGDNLNPLYASDLEEFIIDLKPALWCHGHMHSSSDYLVGSTRVVANPRGYAQPFLPEEAENKGFDSQFVVKV
jgi:Icc-related predicted phosphoesterase